MDMKNAVIYARVSTKDQEREGYSIPAQLGLLRTYANKHNLVVVKEFKESQSAGKAGRVRFSQMIQLLQSDNSIGILLVEKTDRLYRNFKDHVILDDLGIEIHFVKDSRIIGKHSRSTERFAHDIEVAQARFYLNNLSEEVRKGQQQKAKQGQYPGGMVPIGYIRNPLDKTITIDPECSQTIRTVFELYSEGTYSISDLFKYAKKNGLVYRRSGKPLARSAIERMLKTVFYTGKFQWKGLIYQGDHPAIIESSLYELVQNAFKARSNNKAGSRSFTFGQLITCGECGRAITAEIKKGKYTYYHCTGYGNKHKPDYLPETKIDNQFGKIVGQASLPYEFYDFLKHCLDDEYKTKKIAISRERERLELSRDKVQTDMRKTFQAHIDGHIEEKFFQSVYNDYENQLSSIKYRLGNLSESFKTNFDIAQKTIELSHQAESLYVRANPSQKRRLINSLLSNCHLKDGSLCPTYRKPFEIFVEGIKSGNKRRR
ncbi:MAG: recombinase family protein [candidate division Zixibacteria bacterium]|nr:recombinase family protein [candidate division Zixibacteria bacterium]